MRSVVAKEIKEQRLTFLHRIGRADPRVEGLDAVAVTRATGISPPRGVVEKSEFPQNYLRILRVLLFAELVPLLRSPGHGMRAGIAGTVGDRCEV